MPSARGETKGFARTHPPKLLTVGMHSFIHPTSQGLWIEYSQGKDAFDEWVKGEYGFVSERPDRLVSPGTPTFDRSFPTVAYRQGASGQRVPVVAGTGIRVQTIAIAAHQWGLSKDQLAEEYNLSVAQIDDALAFYAANQVEMDGAIGLESAIEAAHA